LYGTYLFGVGYADVAGSCEKVSEVWGISLPADGIEILLNMCMYVNYRLSDRCGVYDRDTL
jgi:hypothetical protein